MTSSLGTYLVFIIGAVFQESWNFKSFTTGGKQNPKSPKAPSKKDESTNVKDNNTETGTDSTAKSPSKHQLKSARKADRVSGNRDRRNNSLK